VTVDADAAEVPVGIDGETVIMAAPVCCAIRPPALQGRVPKDRPGTPPAQARHRLTDAAANWPQSRFAGRQPSPYLTSPGQLELRPAELPESFPLVAQDLGWTRSRPA